MVNMFLFQCSWFVRYFCASGFSRADMRNMDIRLRHRLSQSAFSPHTIACTLIGIIAEIDPHNVDRSLGRKAAIIINVARLVPKGHVLFYRAFFFAERLSVKTIK